MTRRFRLELSLIFALIVGAAACGGPADGPANSSGVELHRGNTAEPLSLDPHKAAGTWENNIIGDMFIGLFTENASAEPVPGMAESWTVSEDGLVWTFMLREATWSDGVPVTADDFVYAFRRIMTPATLSQYASLLYPIQNAEAVNTGVAPAETLGVRAIDPSTLEVRLEHPAPYLPGLLTHYTALPVPKHVVEEQGDAWIQPVNIEVNGPYKLAEWRTNDFVRLEKNPDFYAAEDVCIDTVYFYPTNDTNSAERRVRNGELDLNTDFPGQRLDFFKREIPDYVRVSPFLTTDYLTFNTTRAPFNDSRVRRALAMAVDREFIVNDVLKAGQIPAQSLVPPGIANYDGGAETPWTGMSLDERRAEARRLLIEAGYGPDKPLRFEYTHRNTRDNPRVAPVLQSDWSEIASWVEVDIASIETQIHYANLRARDYQVADAAWVADYNDPQNFLYLLETRSGPMNYSDWSNEEYDQMVDQSSFILDMDQRASMLRQAEQLMLDDVPISPMWHQVNKNLVNPKVTGWVDNVVDIHRTRYLCIGEKPNAEGS